MIVYHTLRCEQWVPCPLHEVFEFFSNACSVEFLTPAWSRFRVVTLPIVMRPGAEIDYRMVWRGVPIRWTTEVLRWLPPHEFVDMQLSGPYKLWHHTHRFAAQSGGTCITDIVQYALPLGPLGWLANALWVRRDIRRMFDYRRDRIGEMFGV